jgi:hypothetical protein
MVFEDSNVTLQKIGSFKFSDEDFEILLSDTDNSKKPTVLEGAIVNNKLLLREKGAAKEEVMSFMRVAEIERMRVIAKEIIERNE